VHTRTWDDVKLPPDCWLMGWFIIGFTELLHCPGKPSGNQTWQSWLAGKSRISRISGSFKWTIIIKMGNSLLLFLGLRKGQQTLGKFWGQ
jgi:hypothetical protein